MSFKPSRAVGWRMGSMHSSRPLGISLGSFQCAQGLRTAAHGEPPAVHEPPLPANWCCRKRCGHRLRVLLGTASPVLRTAREKALGCRDGASLSCPCALTSSSVLWDLWLLASATSSKVSQPCHRGSPWWEPLLRRSRHSPSSYPSSCRNEQLFSSPLTPSLCHVSIQSEFLLCCSSGWREQTSREPSGVL